MISMIAIVDYGAGNLFNIENAVKKMGGEAIITNDKEIIAQANGIILPGVGYAKRAMNYLKEKDIIETIETRVIGDKVPFLGICLGMQLMFEYSEEGDVDGFGWIQGKVEKMDMSLKVPQIGWNNISIKNKCLLLKGIEDNKDFYFIHSYCVKKCPDTMVVAVTEYGENFVSMVQYENMFGTQFHPEKSGKAGWHLIRNFCDFVNQMEAINN